MNLDDWGRTIDGAHALRRLTDLPVALAIAACALLVPVQLGWVAALSHAWGFNLWQYQPPAVAALLGVALLSLAFRRVRSWLLGGIERVEQLIVDAIGRRRALVLLLVAVPVALWFLRERRFYGDSTILVYSSISGSEFVFPEIGASFLLGWSMHVARALGTSSLSVYQLLMCGSGAVAVGCFLGLGRSLAPEGARGSLFAALVLCGGVLRVFAGHVEVYGFVVAAAAAYLWAAAAFLRGRCGYSLPALAFGVGLWIHLSFAFLAPSLVLLLSAMLVGVGLVAFSASNSYWLSVLLLGVVGLGQAGRMSLSNILIQSHVEDAYRGRVMALYMMEFSLMSVSVFLVGILASEIGPQLAVGLSAVGLLLLVSFLLLFSPRYRGLD